MEDDEIITPYLSEEINLNKITPLRTIWEMVRITAWQNFTHHPTCSQYKDHYFRIGKVKLCVGCTSFYSMIVASLIVFFAAYDFFRSNAIILPIVYVYGILAFGMHILTSPQNQTPQNPILRVLEALRDLGDLRRARGSKGRVRGCTGVLRTGTLARRRTRRPGAAAPAAREGRSGEGREGDDGRVYVAKMNIGLMGTVFGGTVADVMAGSVSRDEARMLDGIVH